MHTKQNKQPQKSYCLFIKYKSFKKKKYVLYIINKKTTFVINFKRYSYQKICSNWKLCFGLYNFYCFYDLSLLLLDLFENNKGFIIQYTC